MSAGRRAAALAVVALAACGGEPRLTLRYALSGGLAPGDVSRIETQVAVAPSVFGADSPFRSIGTGVSYEVRDFDGQGTRTILITHDSSLGYEFSPTFTFVLLPPVGDAPPLQLRARAFGAHLGEVLADSGAIAATFAQPDAAELPLADLRCGAARCGTGTACCAGRCTDVAIDVEHCGACDGACGARGDECSGGGCRCNGGGACAPGQTCCAGLGCVATDADPFNCGACGHACAPGEACQAGRCACGATSCQAGEACCDGVCRSGGCACGAITCAADAPLCCGGACASLADDDRNCGACGKTCAAPFRCAAGACACNGGVCQGGDACCAEGCRDLASDPTSCGACGHACGANELCVGGACRCGDASACGDARCCASATGAACVDPRQDEDNCGQCGVTCAGTDQCIDGVCVCPGAKAACGIGETCCGDGCFDLAADAQHCGACDKRCGVGESCAKGQCVPGTPNLCSPACAHGTTCIGATCYCGTTATRCPGPGVACCAGGCVDTLGDAHNCGGCGKDCVAMGLGQLCCNGACAQAGSPTSCGACGNVCGLLAPQCKKCDDKYTCVNGLLGCGSSSN